MEISISEVTGIRVTPIDEYDLDEDEADEEPYYRSLIIETSSGTLEIELDGVSREALEIVEEDDDDDDDDDDD